MLTTTERLRNLGLRRTRHRAGEWWIVDADGNLAGRYGGVLHSRWAVLADDTQIAGPTKASAGVVLGCLVTALEERADIQLCADCGSTDLFSAWFDADGYAHAEGGASVEWRTLCNECGGEWNGTGTEIAR